MQWVLQQAPAHAVRSAQHAPYHLLRIVACSLRGSCLKCHCMQPGWMSKLQESCSANITSYEPLLALACHCVLLGHFSS